MPGQQQIKKGTNYVNYPGSNSQVTAENLNDHVDNATLLGGAISSQAESTPQVLDYILSERGGFLFKYTIGAIKSLFETYFPLRSGSSMTGELLLSSSTPSVDSAAASKGYVDAKATAAAAAATLPGAIVMWGGSFIPIGWLECNGQSTASAPNLIPIYGSNVPDLRGEFVRGWDNQKGVDPGRTLKSTQGGSVESHRHAMFNQRGGGSDGGGPYTQGAVVAGSTDQTGYYGGTETRPRNVALMFIVKT